MADTETRRPVALVVDDDSSSLEALADLVMLEGFSVHTAGTLAEARTALARDTPDVVLLDLVLPDGRGDELFEDLGDHQATEVILVTGKATIETAVTALRFGAFDYLTKPVDLPRLKTLLARVKDSLQTKKEVSNLRAQLRQLGRFGGMVGTSPAMQRVYDLIEKVAPTDATVLLVGESGTGKELAAETVHELSRRRDATYLPINCGAIAENLIESELFGHEKGSFTGASKLHRGHFERCSGGTIFLDEITEMPLAAQVKLLRVLETGGVLRVGGEREIETDVRVIAATNRDPEEAVGEGKLREDLYYRLRVFPIEMPPLRDRAGDVELLARTFVERLGERHGGPIGLSPKALERLEAWHWPGNVRELKNVIERASILAEDEIGPDELPPEVSGEAPPRGPSVHLRVGTPLDEAERRMILATLDQQEGNKRATAATLGVSVKTLYNKLKRYETEDAS